MMTQRELILNYIKDFGSITPLEAFADLGITKLATRISEMRRDGIAIFALASSSSFFALSRSVSAFHLSFRAS